MEGKRRKVNFGGREVDKGYGVGVATSGKWIKKEKQVNITQNRGVHSPSGVPANARIENRDLEQDEDNRKIPDQVVCDHDIPCLYPATLFIIIEELSKVVFVTHQRSVAVS